MDFSNFGDLMDQMKDAYEDGINAMNSMSDLVAEDMDPTHRIDVDIILDGSAEGHPYKVDASLTFLIDLDTIIQAVQSPMGDLSSLLGQMGVDLGGEADAVMEQLSQPRAVGVLKEVNVRTLLIANDQGQVNTGLNEKGTLLAVITDNCLKMNFEGVFSYPEMPDVYMILPTTDKMQENIKFDLDELDQPVAFSWIDQDGLSVSGEARISRTA